MHRNHFFFNFSKHFLWTKRFASMAACEHTYTLQECPNLSGHARWGQAKKNTIHQDQNKTLNLRSLQSGTNEDT